MRILRVISSLAAQGGGPMEGARRIDEALMSKGVFVEVACLDEPSSLRDAPEYPAKIHMFGPTRMGYAYSPTIRQWILENHHRFDAVIVNGLWQYHSLAVWSALRKSSTPYFVFTHGMLDPWFKARYPLKHLKKTIYWLLAENRVLRDAAAVLFTSDEERLLARQSFSPYRVTEKVTAYGTKKPTSEDDGGDERLAEEFRIKYPAICGKTVLLFLSRIHEKKGVDLLISAFSRISNEFPDLHLVIAGPDSNRLTTELQTLASKLGVENRITWPGMLTGKEKWGAFQACHAFCLPSHQENFGIVVAEALACGRPVIISNKVNIWREISTDGAGIVCEDDVDGLHAALIKWLGLSDEERIAMSRRARCSFSSRFDIEIVADSVISIIDGFRTFRPDPAVN